MFPYFFQGDIFVKECKLKPRILMGIYAITTRAYWCEIIILKVYASCVKNEKVTNTNQNFTLCSYCK